MAEGPLAQVHHAVLNPVLELREEAVGQLGPPAEEVVLKGTEGLAVQGPQQPLLAEERVVGEHAGHR